MNPVKVIVDIAEAKAITPIKMSPMRRAGLSPSLTCCIGSVFIVYCAESMDQRCEELLNPADK